MANPFITRSKNKGDGTVDWAELETTHFVVGVGNANT